MRSKNIYPSELVEFTASKEAEINLVSNLLEHYFKKNSRYQSVHRLIAIYPNTPFRQKDKIVTEIFKNIFGPDSFFEAFSAFDNILSATGARGHYVHQFEVFLLGLNFIKLFSARCPDSPHFSGKDEEVILTWMLTSLTHDFGYPVEMAESIISSLGKAYKDFGLSTVSDAYEKIYKEIDGTLYKKFVEGMETNGVKIELCNAIAKTLFINKDEARILQANLVEKKTHGYISSFLLYEKIYQIINKKCNYGDIKSSPFYGPFINAMGATAVHGLKLDNITEIGKINFDNNPYAYILFLFDNLQDWNREIYESRDKYDRAYVKYYLADFSVGDYSFNINYHLSHESWDQVFEDTKKSIDDRRKLLSTPIPPSNKSGLRLNVNFELSNGEYIDPIVVEF